MKTRSRILLALTLVTAIAFAAMAADTLEEVKKKGVLTAGVKYRVPPFGSVDPATNDLVGYDVDVVRAIANKLGVKLETKPVDQKTRIPELIEGNVDLLAANLTQNPDTGKIIDLSEVYLTTGVGFLARKGAISGIGDLAGKKIAVLKGTVAEQAVKTSFSSATTVAFDDLKKALEALGGGAVDAGAGDTSILPAVIKMLPRGEFEIPAIQIAEIPYVLGVRKGDKNLLDFVNKAVREMQQSGELKKLYDKWFKPAAKEPAAAAAPVPARAAPAPAAAAAPAPAAAAAGAIVRKAMTPPGVVVVILKGFFDQGAQVSVYSTKGEFVCKGTVTAIFSDQIYIDVDPARFEAVKPGFAVGMGVKEELVQAAIAKNQEILNSVQAESKKEEEARVSQREQEGLAKEKRQQQADWDRYQKHLEVQAEQAENNNEYYYGNINVHRSWD